MFEARITNVPGLTWVPVAQGPEPRAVMMADLTVLGTRFCLHAFRVAAPCMFGWSSRMAWEGDRTMLGTGVMWREAATRNYVRAADAGDWDNPPEAELNADEREWDVRWMAARALLGGGLRRWSPCMLEGAPYHVVGVPVGTPPPPGCPRLEVTLQSGRKWPGMDPGEFRAGLRLGGGALDLSLLRVRSIGGRVRALATSTTEALEAASALTASLDGTHAAMRLGEGTWTGFIGPADADDWSTDTNGMAEVLAEGLPHGRMRWYLGRSDVRFDAFDARVLENLAHDCRHRTLATDGNGAWMTSSMAALLGDISVGRDREVTKSRLFRMLSRTIMRGVGRTSDGRTYVRKTRPGERIYVFDDAVAVGVHNDFAHAAALLPDGALLNLPWRANVFETDAQETPGTPPNWLNELPVLMDARVTRFLDEWHGEQETH